MDFQRMILFGALGMVLLLLWQSWLEYESGKNNTGFKTQNLNKSNSHGGPVTLKPRASIIQKSSRKTNDV